MSATEIVAAASMGGKEPTKVRLAVGDWTFQDAPLDTAVRIEIGDVQFEGKFSGRGIVCGEDRSNLEVSIELEDEASVERLLEVWRVVGSAKLHVS